MFFTNNGAQLKMVMADRNEMAENAIGGSVRFSVFKNFLIKPIRD